MDQLSLYDIEYEKFKITKPIRLISLFSGYDSQALSLKYLGVPFEHWKTCEWAVKSIQALKDLHFTNEDIELNPNRTKEEMVNFLYQKGISNNYNEPMTKQQINRLSEETLKTIIKNIAITHNLVNIQQVKGKDLEIVDTDKYEYIMTYSFPCQDLSLAGKGKGMSDTSTRSGMLWEVERILTESENKPQILLMENVPMVHSQDNVKDFIKWQLRLEEMGYKNYWKDLIATDYGIPQTRNRTFMVSILGEYSYTFPKPIPLKLKLKDMLEDDVDEKYYLSDKQLQDIQQWNAYQKPLETMEQVDKENISPTITRSGAYAAGMILVKNATKQGYLEATEGDGVDISGRMEYHRGTVQKDKIQTINTNQDYGVVVLGGIGEKKSNSNTQWYMQDRIYDNNVGISLATTANPNYIDKQLRVRKLTTREAFRLMGVKDEDYDNVCKNQNENSLFHLAGDSIVTNVLMAIFKEML